MLCGSVRLTRCRQHVKLCVKFRKIYRLCGRGTNLVCPPCLCRVSLQDNTDNYVKRMREKNGLPKEGIRGRSSMGGEFSDESEYEPSDDEFSVEDM